MSKTNTVANSSSERKLSTSLQISNFMEKVSLKSPVIQNGDSGTAESNGHSPNSGRKRNPENSAAAEISNGNVVDGITPKSSLLESSTDFISDDLDSPSSTDDVIPLGSSKNIEEKPVTRVSSV